MTDRTVPRVRDREHSRQLEAWAKRHPDDPRTPAVLNELLVFDWCGDSEPLSDHLRAEVAAAHWRGEPLEPGQPIPGCPCDDCTGVEAAAPVPSTVLNRDHGNTLPPLPVEAARAVPILDVAAMLGIEHKRGWAICPFHSDGEPSLHLNARKGAAFCNPCGKSWDAIALWMDYRNVEFVDAVKALAA